LALIAGSPERDEVGAIGSARSREQVLEENGLTLVETIAHLHGQGRSTEIRVSGTKLVGRAEYDSKDVLDEPVKTVEEKFSFKPFSFALHFHTPIGYSDVSVMTERRTDITFETMEYDHQVSSAKGYPKLIAYVQDPRQF